MCMMPAIGLHILYWLIDNRVKIGYNYSSTWENYPFYPLILTAVEVSKNVSNSLNI